MSSPFVAEIRIFPFNFAPTGWAFCNGQILSISQNTALFSLLGTNYGGDGRSTFGLPNLQGSSPISQGQGPGLSDRFIGESGGSPTVTLLASEVPPHSHNVAANIFDSGDANVPTGNALAKSSNASVYSTSTTPAKLMAPGTLSAFPGGNQPHNNMSPYLTLNFCIALQGIYPPRS
jgi:microcystin-dependent protein